MPVSVVSGDGVSGMDAESAVMPSKEPILFLTMFIIAGLEIRIMVVQDLPQGRIGGLSRVIDWRDGSHKRSFTEQVEKLDL